MKHNLFTTLAAVLLLLPAAVLASTLSSPSYRSELGDTPSGAGSAASPGYTVKQGIVGSSFAMVPGTSSPGYSVKPGILVKTETVVSTLPTGDIDGDGSVTIADALLALQISVGTVAVTSAYLINGDVAPFVGGKPVPDGIITGADALMILRKVVGLVSW
jgi:hypothetical protein